jgi:formate-dependent phosphoribosylglycinamide formyltransferase (GAR transformylase)
MMRKKVLLVGSSFSAVAILFVLKNQHLHVSVCGNDRADPCHQYADASFFIDYSDKDALSKLIAQEKFDYIVPSCNDYAYMSCAWAAEQMSYPGFDSFEVASILHNKNLFRAFSQQHALATPRFFHLGANQTLPPLALNYPLLVKPVDSFSGRGVSKVNNADELSAAIDSAVHSSRSAEIVVEEFVDGDLYSHSAFIQNGRIIFEVFADEFCTVYPYQVNCSNHPSRLTASVKKNVSASMQQLVSLLRLKDGLLHTQFIAGADQFWIIECMRRCPGDLYGNMITLSTGVDYVDLYTQPFIKKAILAQQIAQNAEIKCIGRHTISVTEPTITLSFSHNIPSKMTQIVPLKSSGEALASAPYDKLAIVFVEYHDEQQMLEVTPQLDQFITIQAHKEKLF